MAEAVRVNEEQQRPEAPREREPSETMQKLTSGPRRFRQFLHDVRMELRNVSWPSWDTVKSTTAVVVLTVFVFAFFLWGVDLGVGWLVSKVLAWFKP